MPQHDRHAPGTFCYAELGTSDPAAAGRFYQTLFGWERRDEETGEFGVYTQFLKAGRVAAAMYKLTPDQNAQGVPSQWGQYISVSDTDAVAARAVDLGGSVLMGPMDVMDYGRMAVLVDPGGAVFCLWQAEAHGGVGVRDEADTMCWSELMTRDLDAAGAFYGELVGWRQDHTDMAGRPYTVCYRDDLSVAGMMAIPADMTDVPSHWLIYFAVTDCDRAAAGAVAAGGGVSVEPSELPGVGRFAVLRDPQSAVFGVVQFQEKG